MSLAFSHAQVEDKTILAYDQHEEIRQVPVGLCENLRQEIDRQREMARALRETVAAIPAKPCVESH